VVDLKTQLGDYFDHVVQHVEVEDVFEERLGSDAVRPIQTRVAPPRPRPWVPALAGFLVVLVAGGLAAISLLGGGTAPRPDTAAIDTAATSQPLVTGEAINPWEKTVITAPWVVGIVDATSLPDGGFAVVASRGGSILWSRDGAVWEEADPEGGVSAAALAGWPESNEYLRVITALPGRVAVLGGTGTEPVVWIGELATQSWESIPLTTDGLVESFERVVITSNDHEVLVVAGYRDSADLDRRSLVWLIDPETGEVERTPLPPELWGRGWEDLEAEWFVDRWVVAEGNTTAVSFDGLSWRAGQNGVGLADEPQSVTSLSAGPDRIIATTSGGLAYHFVWYSEDGLRWTQAPDEVPGPHAGAAYSDALGFVLVPDVGGRVFVSRDGRSWHWTLGPGWEIFNRDIAASGESVFVLAWPPFLLTPE
jgi:hypothetical protein